MMLEDEEKGIILIPETTAMAESLKRCPAGRTWNVTVDSGGPNVPEWTKHWKTGESPRVGVIVKTSLSIHLNTGTQSKNQIYII